jgi:hypothetical protein
MASSVVDTASNLGRKLVDRAKTDVGRDWDAIKKGAKDVTRSARWDYRYATGGNKQSKARKSSSRGGR